jgi:hypothetical protein
MISNHLSFSLVEGLHAPCRPTAIVWRIRAVIIDTIYRIAGRWSFAHIRIERGKGFPSFTYFDAAASVVFIRWIVWIKASLSQAKPSVVKFMLLHAKSHSMNAVAINKSFSLDAPARLRFAAQQMCCKSDAVSSANAATEPDRFTMSIIRQSFDDGQSTKRSRGDIGGLGHGDLLARMLCQVTGRCFNAGPLRILACGSSL